MAVDLSSINNPSVPAIELYRANIAHPETLEELRFWVSNELAKIQAMGVSADEVILLLAQAIGEIEVEGGEQGPPGPAGPAGADGVDGVDGVDGADGTAGDLIDDIRTLFDKTWSSDKINTLLNRKADKSTFNAHANDQYLHPGRMVLAGGDSASVQFTHLNGGSSTSTYSVLHAVNGGASG